MGKIFLGIGIGVIGTLITMKIMANKNKPKEVVEQGIDPEKAPAV